MKSAFLHLSLEKDQLLYQATEGLRLLCRDSYDHEKSHFDAPLASRFEEMDAVVLFDNVLVPWERVFMYREHEFAVDLVEKFASYHRQSYACWHDVSAERDRDYCSNRRLGAKVIAWEKFAFVRGGG